MNSFSKIVKQYEKECRKHDIPEETVMAYLVELSQAERYALYLHFDEEMPQDLYTKFKSGMDRILKGEPMEHVLGYSWFYGYKMIVDGSVLIPRPETEELCAHVLGEADHFFSNKKELLAADVGTGSGAIAITLKKEEPKMNVTATDISEEALVTAKKNAHNNEADIQFVAGDMLAPLMDLNNKLDILVSNPPYIPQKEKMEKSVVDYEPHVALFGGDDGLKFYKEIFKNCKKVLKDHSFMAFEMGWDEKERLSQLVEEYFPDTPYRIYKDMNGKDRMLFVYFGLNPD